MLQRVTLDPTRVLKISSRRLTPGRHRSDLSDRRWFSLVMSRTCSSLQGAPLSRLVLWEQVDNGAEKLEIGVNIVLSPALASRSGHL